MSESNQWILEHATYCGNMYKSLYLERVDEKTAAVGPCCLNVDIQRENRYHTIDFYRNRYLEDIRQKWRSEPVASCEACWRQEREGNLSSNRRAINEWYHDNFEDLDPEQPELLKLDFNVSPICNAKCIICSSRFSSLWAEEDRKFGLTADRSYSEVRDNTVWQDLDLSRLRYLYFNGGEPLLSPEPVELLHKVLHEQGNLDQLEFYVSTNGSVAPSQQLIELWLRCRRVDIWISLDAIEDAFEYIRYPLKWPAVWQNIMFMGQLDPKISVNLGFTIGVHNIDSFLPAYRYISQYCDSINGGDIGLVRCFGDLDIDKASHELIQLWKETYDPRGSDDQKLKELHTLVASTAGRANNDVWQQHLERIDQRRGLDWRAALPRLAEQEKKATQIRL